MQGNPMPLSSAAGHMLRSRVERTEPKGRAPAGASAPAAGTGTADGLSGQSTDGADAGRGRAGPSRPRIVFLVMSAVARPETVDQLARSLEPHTVLVHHDFSQTPDFQLTAPNVRFVPDPVRTGWAEFGFVEGIFHSLGHAIEALDFDYLQLLSPSCLPIQPMQAFERHVSALEEAHFDCLDMERDIDVRMSVGYRAWTAQDTLAYRIMRRLVNVYFGTSAGRRNEAGVWVRSGRAPGLAASFAGLALDALQSPLFGRHMRGHRLPLYYGSTWFGARRHIVYGMVRGWRQPSVREYFRRVRIAEEFLVPSLLMRLRPHKGPTNHLVQHFNEAHPGRFEMQDLERLRQSGAFFARKFADDPEAPIRRRVLEELACCAAQAADPLPSKAALA